MVLSMKLSTILIFFKNLLKSMSYCFWFWGIDVESNIVEDWQEWYWYGVGVELAALGMEYNWSCGLIVSGIPICAVSHSLASGQSIQPPAFSLIHDGLTFPVRLQFFFFFYLFRYSLATNSPFSSLRLAYCSWTSCRELLSNGHYPFSQILNISSYIGMTK